MNKQTPEYHAARAISWTLYLTTCLWLAVAASWWSFSRVDYGFPLWYQWLAIDQHIDRYAPQHPDKTGFAQLPPEQHHRAFAQIVSAIHERGETLTQIYYQAPNHPRQRLLDQAEVRHLEDVRALLALAGTVSLFMALLWLPAALLSLRLGMPSARGRLVTGAVLALLVLAPLVVWGPKTVFYQLHVWLFPAENQWFFYWQESLMSTLMRAPVLFGGIAVEIALLALLLLPFFYFGGRSVGRRLLEVK